MLTLTRLSRIAFALFWLAVTAGVAFLVARYAADGETTDITAPLPPVAATATLTEQEIASLAGLTGRLLSKS